MKKETVNAYANQIKKQLDRLNRLEEALLMLSRIDAGTLLLKQESVDLYTALHLAAENLSDLLRDNHISVEIPDNGCMEFSGDLEWTMEAFINLMKKLYGTFTAWWNSSTVITLAILFIQKSGYGTMEQVLIRRIYRISLIVFIVAGVLQGMGSESVWPLPVPSSSYRTGRFPPIIAETAARVLK